MQDSFSPRVVAAVALAVSGLVAAVASPAASVIAVFVVMTIAFPFTRWDVQAPVRVNAGRRK